MHAFAVTAFAAALGLAALPAAAQQHEHTPGMTHDQAMDMSRASGAALPREGGQSAFAAVGEIANMLQADPTTAWAKVDLDGLRRHLVDMDNVMLHAQVVSTPVPGGARFEVSGDTQEVRASIRHMVAAHTIMGEDEAGRRVVSAPTEQGATMTVTGQGDVAQAKVRALGFFGLLAGGSHHQQHHMMMARGEMRH